MPSFDQLKELLIIRLYEEVIKPASSGEIFEDQIIELLIDQTGMGVAKQALAELQHEGFLQQTSVAYGSDSARFEVTAKLIRHAEQLDRPTTVDGQPINFTQFRDQLLIALAKEEERESGVDFFDLVFVADKHKLQYKDGWVSKAAVGFKDFGYIQDSFSHGSEESSGWEARLTGHGLAAVEALEAPEAAPNLTESLFDHDGIDDIAADGVDGADDSWEPLKIDRRSQEYEQAVEVIEEALGVIEGNNGYATSVPEERGQIVWSIKEGLRAIKENLPSYAQVQSMVVQPLRFVSKKFAETAMGEIAKKALGHLFTWLASLM